MYRFPTGKIKYLMKQLNLTRKIRLVMTLKTRTVRKFLALVALVFVIDFYPQSSAFEIKIWPNGPLFKFNHENAEEIENRNIEQNEFGLNRSIRNVSEPTLTVYLAPKEKSNGTAALIFPGGGYNRIVIDKEGHDVARWLNSEGITGIVVKYRTAPEGIKIRGELKNNEIKDAILSDAVEAVNIVHARSSEWYIDPNKIGAIGFSAGGHLCVLLCSSIQQERNDNSFIPKFVGLIYPVLENDFDLKEIKNFPPTFIVSARDDKVSLPNINHEFYNHLQQNNIQSGLHLYETGGHGFGLGVRGGEVVTWKDYFLDWLKTSKLLQ